MNNGKKQQGEATRKQILEVTARRFAQHGYEGTSLEAIAKEVGVAKSSVLWHFGSKESLLYEVIQGVMTSWEKERTAELLAVADPRERLLRTIDACRAFAKEHPDTLLLFLTVMLHGIDSNPELTAKFREMYRGYRKGIRLAVELGIQEGAFRKDVSADEVAGMVVGAFDGLFLQWYLDREEFDLDAATESLKRFVTRYLTQQAAQPAERQVAAAGSAN